MAFPFFSLEKSKRTKPIIYEQGDIKVVIAGLTTVGIATIWDADLLIWAASQLNAALEAVCALQASTSMTTSRTA
jgi:plasmid replication initiation protein